MYEGRAHDASALAVHMFKGHWRCLSSAAGTARDRALPNPQTSMGARRPIHRLRRFGVLPTYTRVFKGKNIRDAAGRCFAICNVEEGGPLCSTSLGCTLGLDGYVLFFANFSFVCSSACTFCSRKSAACATAWLLLCFVIGLFSGSQLICVLPCLPFVVL